MPFLARTFTAFAMALTLAAAPAGAGEIVKAAYGKTATPVGIWQTTSGDARFKVSLCGDGTQLCAKLTWLRKDVRSAENLRYLDKYVVERAQPVEINKWRSTVNYNGETLSGSLTLVGDSMSLRGCKGIFCQSIEFLRF